MTKPSTAALRNLLATRQFFTSDLYTFTMVDGTQYRYCTGDKDVTVVSPNFLLNSDDLTISPWSAFGSTISKVTPEASFAVIEDGANTQHNVLQNATKVAAKLPFYVVVEMKKGIRNLGGIVLSDGVGNGVVARVNFNTKMMGSLTSFGTGWTNLTGGIITFTPDGYIRFFVSATSNQAAIVQTTLTGLSDAGATVYTGTNGATSVRIRFPQTLQLYPTPTTNDQYVKSLLHFDGVDGATSFVDENAGGSARTWTASGNAQLDTAVKKFGTASGLFDGTGDFISTPDSADFNLGTGNFTIDGWFNCTAPLGTARAIAGQSDDAATPSLSSFIIRIETTGVLTFRASTGSIFGVVNGTTVFSNTLNTGWHHFAAVRNGGTLRLYVDGILEGENTGFGGITVPDSASLLYVGQRSAVADPWMGSIDEFRLSVGIARWAEAFTPPTAPYETITAETPISLYYPNKATRTLVYASGGQTGPFMVRKGKRTRVTWKAGLAVDKLNFAVIPEDATILNGLSWRKAAMYGFFDGATVQLDRAYMASYGDVSAGTVLMFLGRVGELDIDGMEINFSINSHLELLDIDLPRNLFQPGCVNSLGDAACGVPLSTLGINSTIIASTTNSVLYAVLNQATDYFSLGKVKMTSGANNGLWRTVKKYTSGGILQLSTPFPVAPVVGDTFIVFPGCDKTKDLSGCGKFAGSPDTRYRGFRFIPQPETAV